MPDETNQGGTLSFVEGGLLSSAEQTLFAFAFVRIMSKEILRIYFLFASGSGRYCAAHVHGRLKGFLGPWRMKELRF